LNDDDDFSAEEGGAARWKENMLETAQKLHGKRRSFRTSDLAKLMYDESLTAAEVLKRWRGEVEEEEEDDIEESDDETFFKKSGRENADEKVEDRAIPILDYDALEEKWSVEDNIEVLRRRFATADLLREKNEDRSGSDDGEGEDSDDEGDGEFQDLEAVEEQREDDIEAEREKNARRKEELKLRFEEEDREGFNNDKAKARREGAEDEEFGEDDWYDAQKAQIQKQLNINKAEFELLDDSQACQR
jgi:ribosome biogenesis protein BMS1